jgi:hypothetical protein
MTFRCPLRAHSSTLFVDEVLGELRCPEGRTDFFFFAFLYNCQTANRRSKIHITNDRRQERYHESSSRVSSSVLDDS